ncbi:MAG TPA: sulfite exporter TauE/SafE family protein [Candidatus Eisenbacteria bacterium]|nr:sulfite exporter TauE/SafE family protein [Candidatus Eisenbacteria bacterium]
MTFRESIALPVLFGALAGGLGGLMGVGGGIVLVPLLLYFLHQTQHEAQGTSLAFFIVTALVAAVPYIRAESVRWDLVGVLALGAVPGVMAGAAVAKRTPAARLRLWFGLAILATALRLLLAPPAGLGGAPWALPWNVLLGLGVGAFAGLLGVGGGIILVPALVLAQGFDQHLAQGVSLALIVPIGLVGAVSYARAGHTRLHVLPALFAGGALGGWLGATFAQSLRGPVLTRIFALFSIAVAVRMIAGSRRSAPIAAPSPAGGTP